jgi:hypothetical protein
VSRYTVLREKLLDSTIKLITMRDSCFGVFETRSYPQNFSWFEAAAAICQETIELIREVVGVLDKADK